MEATLNDLMDASLIIHEGKRGKGRLTALTQPLASWEACRTQWIRFPAGWNDALTHGPTNGEVNPTLDSDVETPLSAIVELPGEVPDIGSMRIMHGPTNGEVNPTLDSDVGHRSTLREVPNIDVFLLDHFRSGVACTRTHGTQSIGSQGHHRNEVSGPARCRSANFTEVFLTAQRTIGNIGSIVVSDGTQTPEPSPAFVLRYGILSGPVHNSTFASRELSSDTSTLFVRTLVSRMISHCSIVRDD
ncbi:hypothetical protein WN48_10670 [Eufriesea mexicana]|uniref:Uncharacterized protein n=1 Tax=Eufriesea mexicana TaxID=516756 RepID=A0A310SMN3_9HYME|nr:hypothetical protein WN48_10670 [Eufriesea mexicana]